MNEWSVGSSGLSAKSTLLVALVINPKTEKCCSIGSGCYNKDQEDCWDDATPDTPTITVTTVEVRLDGFSHDDQMQCHSGWTTAGVMLEVGWRRAWIWTRYCHSPDVCLVEWLIVLGFTEMDNWTRAWGYFTTPVIVRKPRDRRSAPSSKLTSGADQRTHFDSRYVYRGDSQGNCQYESLRDSIDYVMRQVAPSNI